MMVCSYWKARETLIPTDVLEFIKLVQHKCLHTTAAARFLTEKNVCPDGTVIIQVLKTQISKLKKFGRRFNFAEHAPDIIPRGEVPHQFVRYYILGSLVVASMLGFSAIMLISCQKILCDN